MELDLRSGESALRITAPGGAMNARRIMLSESDRIGMFCTGSDPAREGAARGGNRR
jgi:hypothetical protein